MIMGMTTTTTNSIVYINFNISINSIDWMIYDYCALLIRGCQECREHKDLLALKDPRYVEG